MAGVPASLSKSQAEGELHNARRIRLAGDDSEGGVSRSGRRPVRECELYAIEEIKKLRTEFRSERRPSVVLKIAVVWRPGRVSGRADSLRIFKRPAPRNSTVEPTDSLAWAVPSIVFSQPALTLGRKLVLKPVRFGVAVKPRGKPIWKVLTPLTPQPDITLSRIPCAFGSNF